RIATRAPERAGRIRGNLGAQGATHELVHRDIEMLALDIPERDIDAAERRYDEALLALIAEAVEKLRPNPLGCERIGAEEMRAESRDHRRVGTRGPETFAPAHGAILAHDLDDAGLPCRIGGMRGRERLRKIR